MDWIGPGLRGPHHETLPSHSIINLGFEKTGTVVPGFRVLGFSALPGFRALKAGNGAWSVHKTLFGFKAPLSKLLIKKISFEF